MLNLDLSNYLFFLFLSILTTFSYSGYAKMRNWPIGALFSDKRIELLLYISLFIVFIAGFFIVEWYEVLIGAFIAWLISGAVTAIFKANTQPLSLFAILVSLILFVIKLISISKF
jgi:hypothetical protein